MKRLLLLLILAASTAFAARPVDPLPAELLGEWRSNQTDTKYLGIYIYPDGVAGFIAAAEQDITSSRGLASYDAKKRTLTLNFPSSYHETFTLSYNPKKTTLKGNGGFARAPFTRISYKAPDYIARAYK